MMSEGSSFNDFFEENVVIFEDLLEEDENLEEGGEVQRKKRRRVRSRITQEMLDQSIWGQLINHPNVVDPESYEGIKFRLRFRVPYGVFKETLVPYCIAKNIFQYKKKSQIGVEYKILVCLRILGRGHDLDSVNELSLIPTSTCHYIFKQFIYNFSAAFYDRHVYMPVGDELKKVMEVYKLLGFNGAIGSMDCTHVKWNKCPASKQTFCIGKEGHATLSFQCIVDHDKRVMAVSNVFWGAANDKET
jgi:hypothetical protein